MTSGFLMEIDGMQWQFQLNGRQRVVGIGSALVDVLAHGSDALLEALDIPRGGMRLVDNAAICRAIDAVPGPVEVVPGGSACNTAVGVGRLGGPARFIGRCGSDATADLFRRGLAASGVDAALAVSNTPTGQVLSVITDDAQRSMLTCLGAAGELAPEDVGADMLAEAAVVHVEGYLAFNADLIESILVKARQAGAAVSLDLASYTVVAQCRDLFQRLAAEYVDILVANEDEASAFTGSSDPDRALSVMAETVGLAVYKRGARGSRIAHAGGRIDVAPVGNGAAVDTTGAGDLWAAGFLYGLTHGLDLDASGRLGSWCGYEVCQVVGATISDAGWQRIYRQR